MPWRSAPTSIATGHYAQVREFLGAWQLLKAEDGTKDQSYFLHRLTQAQLSKTLFPVGHLYKRDVRRSPKLPACRTTRSKDSTGICFIGERPFREFLARYLPKQPGEIRDAGWQQGARPASGLDASHHRPAQGAAASVASRAMAG
jgi:tRNA-specific 2-thiouridylase